MTPLEKFAYSIGEQFQELKSLEDNFVKIVGTPIADMRSFSKLPFTRRLKVYFDNLIAQQSEASPQVRRLAKS
jgi:hypothetical protein